MTSPAGPSDQGLAGERTTLAWARTGLALLAVPSGVLALAWGEPLAVVAAACAVATGLALLVTSLRRQRADRDMVTRRASVLRAEQVILAGLAVVLIDAAAFALIIAEASG